MTGSYGGVLEARSCSTMIAAVDLKTGALLQRDITVTRRPPEMVTLRNGEGTGTYEVKMGISALSDWFD